MPVTHPLAEELLVDMLARIQAETRCASFLQIDELSGVKNWPFLCLTLRTHGPQAMRSSRTSGFLWSI